MFCCTLRYVHSSIAIILIGKRELVALLNLSSWCLVMVERLFLAVPRGCLRFVIAVFPDHTHLIFLRDHPIKELLSNEMVGMCQIDKLCDKAKLIPSMHITSKRRCLNFDATSRRRLDVDTALF